MQHSNTMLNIEIETGHFKQPTEVVFILNKMLDICKVVLLKRYNRVCKITGKQTKESNNGKFVSYPDG